MKTIKGILFDKDGTLIDFNGSWLQPYLDASAYLAESVGKPEMAMTLMIKGGYIPDTKSWVPDSLLASGSNLQILDFWERELGVPMEGDRLDEIQAIFAHAGSAYVPVMDDLAAYLDSLKSMGLKLGLATMDDVSNAESMITKLGLENSFDFVCGANSGFGVKPEPGMIMAFCEQCDLKPESVMMVGDSPKDLNMGKNAGAGMTVGVLTGAHDRELLSQYGDVVLTDISGIVEILH